MRAALTALSPPPRHTDDVGLFKEHVWLKETKSGIRASEQQLARDKDQLARYEELQAASQRDVERAETRNKLEEEKKLLERALPWLEAEEGRRRHDEAKETEKQWTAEVAKRKAEHEQASAPLKCAPDPPVPAVPLSPSPAPRSAPLWS